jgi:hypothetical protein
LTRCLRPASKRQKSSRFALFLGINGHALREPLDEDTAERFVIDAVTGKLEIAQIAAGLLGSPSRTRLRAEFLRSQAQGILTQAMPVS